MKRFYTAASVSPGGAILLDDRPMLTPARLPLALPTPALAEAIADEWCRQGDTIEPRSMPLTGLANAAIDRIAGDRSHFVAILAAYAETDLLCYRASEPPALAERQAALWNPLLEWARSRYDVGFVVVEGILHRPQPAATVARLAEAVAGLDSWELAALLPLVTIGGSLVTALAIQQRAVTPQDAVDAVEVDGDWQAERWGADHLAIAARAHRKTEFLAAARFLDLLR